eukprot:TRINITY_DN772_c5_g1_i1.p1 TRINITY_DN772_c5_g1~~TRINITY_DN772_c5_g1_i1.p1  ORF type:complete len:328 (+),score=53.87 TRINITY_DN772_c5_g1_i1:149-985(+)
MYAGSLMYRDWYYRDTSSIASSASGPSPGESDAWSLSLPAGSRQHRSSGTPSPSHSWPASDDRILVVDRSWLRTVAASDSGSEMLQPVRRRDSSSSAGGGLPRPKRRRRDFRSAALPLRPASDASSVDTAAAAAGSSLPDRSLAGGSDDAGQPLEPRRAEDVHDAVLRWLAAVRQPSACSGSAPPPSKRRRTDCTSPLTLCVGGSSRFRPGSARTAPPRAAVRRRVWVKGHSGVYETSPRADGAATAGVPRPGCRRQFQRCKSHPLQHTATIIEHVYR